MSTIKACGTRPREGWRETMTPEEFAAKMAEIADDDNQENRHLAGDHLLCRLLIELGFDEGVAVFESMGKWYS